MPDAVLRPADEAQAAAVMVAALAHDAVLIPFGGGSSISGSLEAAADERRPVLSVDLGRMDQLLELDEQSGLARVQGSGASSVAAATLPTSTAPSRAEPDSPGLLRRAIMVALIAAAGRAGRRRGPTPGWRRSPGRR